MSTTKAWKNYFPVLLCTTKLAQSISQYYFVLQSLHKTLPSTTLYYKACANYFPVLLCTAKLHKLLPSITLYYKACTKHFPVLLCDTKLAQRKLLHTASSFAEKLLHRASFLNREAFTHSKLSHTASVYTQNTYTQCFLHMGKRLHTQKLLHGDAFTHREAFTQQAFTHKIFCTQQAFTHSKPLRTEHLHTVLLHVASVYTHTQQAF